MKKIIYLFVAFVVLIGTSCQNKKAMEELEKMKVQIEKNELIKKSSTLYHDLNPANIDVLLSEDFVGHGENGHKWDRESHRKYLSNGNYKVDKITRQIAEGDLVATMFTRTMEYKGDTIPMFVMQFKRFEDGLLVEVWEYYDFNEESTDE